MIVLDTSVLVESLGAGGAMREEFRRAIASGHRMATPALVLHEWLRGPRLEAELALQEAVLPSAEALAFGPDEAAAAAELYRRVARARGREIDLAIAACALVWDGALDARPRGLRGHPGAATPRVSRWVAGGPVASYSPRSARTGSSALARRAGR